MPKPNKTKQYAVLAIERKEVNRERATLLAVFSTEDKDRHGDIVRQNWDLKNFKVNPVILNSHNYNDALEVIGKAPNTKVKDGQLQGEIEFAVNENPKARIIFELYAGGYLNAFSVGFIPLEWDEKGNITKSELLEVSAVSVPANAYALAKAKGIDVELLDKKDVEPSEQAEDTEMEESDEEVETKKKKPQRAESDSTEESEEEETEEKDESEVENTPPADQTDPVEVQTEPIADTTDEDNTVPKPEDDVPELQPQFRSTPQQRVIKALQSLTEQANGKKVQKREFLSNVLAVINHYDKNSKGRNQNGDRSAIVEEKRLIQSAVRKLLKIKKS